MQAVGRQQREENGAFDAFAEQGIFLLNTFGGQVLYRCYAHVLALGKTNFPDIEEGLNLRIQNACRRVGCAPPMGVFDRKPVFG